MRLRMHDLEPSWHRPLSARMMRVNPSTYSWITAPTQTTVARAESSGPTTENRYGRLESRISACQLELLATSCAHVNLSGTRSVIEARARGDSVSGTTFGHSCIIFHRRKPPCSPSGFIINNKLFTYPNLSELRQPSCDGSPSIHQSIYRERQPIYVWRA